MGGMVGFGWELKKRGQVQTQGPERKRRGKRRRSMKSDGYP